MPVPRNHASFHLPEYRSRRKDFLKPASADIFVLLQSKVYSFHYKYVWESGYFSKQSE
jgi:hypothetical protein